MLSLIRNRRGSVDELVIVLFLVFLLFSGVVVAVIASKDITSEVVVTEAVIERVIEITNQGQVENLRYRIKVKNKGVDETFYTNKVIYNSIKMNKQYSITYKSYSNNIDEVTEIIEE